MLNSSLHQTLQWNDLRSRSRESGHLVAVKHLFLLLNNMVFADSLFLATRVRFSVTLTTLIEDVSNSFLAFGLVGMNLKFGKRISAVGSNEPQKTV